MVPNLNYPFQQVENLVVAPITDSPKPPPNRVTLTLPVINKSKKVMFLVTGDNKAEVIKVTSCLNVTSVFFLRK